MAFRASGYFWLQGSFQYMSWRCVMKQSCWMGSSISSAGADTEVLNLVYKTSPKFGTHFDTLGCQGPGIRDHPNPRPLKIKRGPVFSTPHFNGSIRRQKLMLVDHMYACTYTARVFSLWKKNKIASNKNYRCPMFHKKISSSPITLIFVYRSLLKHQSEAVKLSLYQLRC